MTGLAILLLASAIAYGFARWRRLPSVPFLLIAGLALRFMGVLPERELLEDTVQLGLAFLVFAAGIELNPRRVGGQRRAALQVGIAQFILLAAVGYGAVVLLGAEFQQAVYLALALAASSTLLVVRLLQQRKQMFEPFGRLVLGVLLLQDMLVILLLPVLTGLPEGPLEVLRGVATTAILVAAAFASIRWLTPYILRLDLDEEGLLLATLALLFLFIGAAYWLGLPMIAGAFVAGVALSAFPVNGIVAGQLRSLSDFFLAIFLTALGGLVGVPTQGDLVISIVLILVVILLTPPLVTIIAEAAGLSARAAIEAGLLLAQTSEFSLVVALQGWSEGYLPESVLTIVVIVTMATMFLTPFIASNRMTWRLMAIHPLRDRGAEAVAPPSGHVLLIGCGDNGLPLLETLLGAGHSVVVVDDDPAVIESLREGDVPCIRGDGSDFDVLDRAGAKNAEIIISTMRRPRDSLHLLRRVRDVPVLVRVFDADEERRIARHGGIPISYAEAATEDFLEWLDQAELVGLKEERRTRPRK